jgi:hypothetical protein
MAVPALPRYALFRGGGVPNPTWLLASDAAHSVRVTKGVNGSTLIREFRLMKVLFTSLDNLRICENVRAAGAVMR